MYQVPPETWNAIAKEQRLETRLAKKLFPTKPDKMVAALEEAEQELVGRGFDLSVAVAFLTTFPLLLEREAIAAYLTAHPEMQPALLTLESPEEAVEVASRDREMSPDQRTDLRAILRALAA